MRLLAWPRKSQQNKIVAREQGVDDLRHDGIFVAVNAGKKRLVALNQAQNIAANFVFHRAGNAAGVKIGNALQLAESARLRV